VRNVLTIKGTGEYAVRKKASQERQQPRESNLLDYLKAMDNCRSKTREGKN